jgi:hypothetical protein
MKINQILNFMLSVFFRTEKLIKTNFNFSLEF